MLVRCLCQLLAKSCNPYLTSEDLIGVQIDIVGQPHLHHSESVVHFLLQRCLNVSERRYPQRKVPVLLGYSLSSV